MSRSTLACTFRRAVGWRRRGAVAIEALIVSGVLTSVLAGTLFLHRVYQTKLRVIREAREAAWIPALKGCSQPPKLSTLAPTTAALGNESGSPGISEQTFETWVTTGDHEKTGSEQVSGRLGTYTMTSKNVVACNPVTSEEEGLEALADVIIQTVNRE